MRRPLSLTLATVLLLAGPLARAQSPSSAPPAAASIAEQFVQLVEQGKGDAVIDWVNAHGSGFAERDHNDPRWATEHRQGFQRFLASAGGPLRGHALIVERVVGDRLVHRSYAFFGAQRPLAIGLTLYRNGDGAWLVLAWSFGQDVAALVDPGWHTS